MTQAEGYRYKKAHQPDLYCDIIGQPHESEQKVAWINDPGNEEIGLLL